MTRFVVKVQPPRHEGTKKSFLVYFSCVINTDIVDWLSCCKHEFIPYFQNNWTLPVSKERTIRTQMTTDYHG